MRKIKKILFETKSFLRNIYSFLLCNQECIICKAETNTSLPLCDDCIKSKIENALDFRLEHPEAFCQNCSHRLISEKELCTSCRALFENENEVENSNENIVCDKIFAIYPYQDKIGKCLIEWKNFNNKVFAELFAQVIYKFIDKNAELKNIAIVPVPPRPKKIKTKGWDQIEELCKQLEVRYNTEILYLLKREDGIAQKNLSSKMRKTNLKGKIHLKNQKSKIPEKLIILDDVTTTGSTLHECAKALKTSGCKKIYGLTIFFD